MLSIRKRIVLFLLVAAYFTVSYALMRRFGISCVFLEIFGIPCPGCGMTRAFLSLLRLDILDAIKYNVVILFMPYVFVYVFFNLKHRVHNYLLSIVAVTAIINWIIKIIIRG